MKHKHCDLIKAWADGAEIQIFVRGGIASGVTRWLSVTEPDWNLDADYRIKPHTIDHSIYDVIDYFTENSAKLSNRKFLISMRDDVFHKVEIV